MINIDVKPTVTEQLASTQRVADAMTYEDEDLLFDALYWLPVPFIRGIREALER